MKDLESRDDRISDRSIPDHIRLWELPNDVGVVCMRCSRALRCTRTRPFTHPAVQKMSLTDLMLGVAKLHGL